MYFCGRSTDMSGSLVWDLIICPDWVRSCLPKPSGMTSLASPEVWVPVIPFGALTVPPHLCPLTQSTKILISWCIQAFQTPASARSSMFYVLVDRSGLVAVRGHSHKVSLVTMWRLVSRLLLSHFVTWRLSVHSGTPVSYPRTIGPLCCACQ